MSVCATCNDALQELRSLSKVLKARQSKQRFPYACKNGPTCKFLACGSCWFQHEEAIAHGKVETREPIRDAIEKKIMAVQSVVEKKINDLSKYVDNRLGLLEAKLESVLEATLKNESDICMLEAENEKLDARESSKKIKDELEPECELLDERIDTKLNEFMKTTVKTAFEGAMTAFAEHVGKRVTTIEAMLKIGEESETGESRAEKT
mmetsp:Transcript_37584/g.59447  ORF Transcript_37584/g.59447 Transcript_37584/m.59447 type:complete len:207 (-) Transcript_37584:74-694(-)